ncbi:EI24 domain-containing protein [Sulfurospirillum sp. 1612]|uniref:EI24 domain-containing protein n=1 Tax=Sulfurospirillum sp. 1612 TaxID=3094835 RepID=UPI002F94ECA1
MNENLLTQSIKDYLTPKMLKYAILPFVVTMVVMYVIFFGLAGMGLDQLHTTMDVNTTHTTIVNGIPQTDTFSAHLQNSSIIKFLMNYTITSWLAGFLIYAIGGFFILYFSIFIAIIVIGFMTPFVMKELQRRHYPEVKMIGYSGVFESIFLVIQWAFVMILLFVVLIPLYFIPLLNIIAFNVPLYYFFHKMLVFDVASHIATREEDRKIRYLNKTSLRIKTVLLYLLSLVPFAIFFGAIFYVIYLGNTYFTEIKKIRN